ncbi:hypothetical protein PHSY_001402 [Pseudozyma hubeiensis SY62]|uniref:Uncharacterized protein n=1 Tax=Pseudozyma hubeiensis (strain SY62) TaxID=1305764 RepID=R9NYW8_PSEHS|nr:hypothetical protein PHSY_001402 [Pseudozyma hubeiensis SY62]GAC93837.1 hypothetical protein PHSY_001402 [Pseudozyma hubeiensis SY62]
MASASVMPELSQPSTLLTHPTLAAADLARNATLPATGFSTTKTSTISVGSAYKLSPDARSLRRLKGTLPLLVAGNALNLINPQSQTPIQSFSLSSAEIASCAPLTLLRSIGSGRSIRTTFIGIESHTRAKSGRAAITATHQLWAYVEHLSAKGKESAEVEVKKESLSVSKPIRLIHALGDGRLVLTHSDDSLTLVSSSPLTFDDEVSIQAEATSLQVMDTVEASQHQTTERCHFFVNLLDPASAKGLIAGNSRIEEAALLGLRLAVTSDTKSSNTSTNNDDDASKKKKRSKRSKKVSNEGDDDESQAADASLPQAQAPTGSLTLELTAFVKSFDGASESSIAIVRLGNAQVPGISTARHVVDVQMHPGGRLAIFGFDGQLTSTTLTTSANGEPRLTHASASYLDALAHASSSRPSSSSTASPSCLLLLSRDHALVVGVTRATPATADKERVVALIVDLELNAVLKQIDWAVPFVPASSAAASSSGLLQRMTTVSASRIAGSTSVITMGPPTVSTRTSSSSEKAEALAQLHQRRVCVLSVPFAVPEMSVLRDALGKGELTARWIQTADDMVAEVGTGSAASDAGRAALLEQIGTISQSSDKPLSKDAKINTALSSWIDVATEDGRMLETLTAHDSDSSFYSQLLDLLLPAPSSRSSKSNGAAAAASFLPRAALLALLNHPLVHPSIFATLKPSAATAAPARIVSLQANGSGLTEFWARLGAWNDAQLTRAALKRMPDVGEDTFASLLLAAMRGLLQSRRSGETVSAKATRPYMALLAELVQLRISRAALRSALKTQLRDDVDQVMALLQLCNAWLTLTIQKPLTESGGSEKMSQSDSARSGKAQVPDADSVMALANDVLDTFFPLLLATPRSHATVQSLSSTISRYLQLMSTLRLLNAPLSAFAKLQQENSLLASSEAVGRTPKTGSGGTTLSASGAVASAGNAKVEVSSKADAAARAEMGGGLGIKLGTQGEAKTRRLQLFEQSMLVGAYSFERLEI